MSRMILRWGQGTLLATIAAALCACGAADTDSAASSQAALAATIAAAPTADHDEREAAPTKAPFAATPAATAQPRPTEESSPTATLAADTTPTEAVPTPPTATPLPEPSATPAEATPTATLAADTTPTETVPTPPTATPLPEPSAAPSDILPTAAPTEAPTAAPAASNSAPASISFVELYSGASITGPVLSDKATRLNGSKVRMQGYMAPPLKPNLDFFVLTKDPMVYCPFCSSAADWPYDIVFVRMADGTVPSLVPTQSIIVTGTFETGTATDAATGFVSQVRIIADTVEVQ